MMLRLMRGLLRREVVKRCCGRADEGGRPVEARPPGFKANAIEYRDGRWIGAADPRSEGTSVGE